MTTSKEIPPLAAKASDAVRRMTDAANSFLNTLGPQERATAILPFAGGERYEWAYTPIDRNGLKIEHMSQDQRDAAMRLLDTGLSDRGSETVRAIIALETVLHEWESMENEVSQWDRSTERYWFTVFGTPGSSEPWGWRAGGHHIGVSATIVNGELVTVNPLFFGSNPATVLHGAHKGQRTLAEEEDWARALVKSMSDGQKKSAIVDPVAPSDILSKNYRVADPNAAPVGISFGDLEDGQRDQLVKLVRLHVTRAADDLAANYWRHIESIGMDAWTFAWAGPEEQGQGHYYAVRAPGFVIEYDNTQNGANHIHSVMRDFQNDWGEDLLAAHYRGNGHHA